MLNTNLKLDEKMFDNSATGVPTRNGLGEGLVELAKDNPNIVVLTADLAESTRVDKFKEAYPERFFECGVAEQNMAAIAAGLGVSGKIPFISSYATFSPGKNWETIRTTIIYNESNVKIAGHHSGIVTGPDGATHQATEDIAIMRCLPGVKIIVPCDWFEAKKATIAAANIKGPVYLRFTRDKTPVMTTDKTPFEIGRVDVYWQSDSPEAVIFATGHLLFEALVAARELEGEKVNVLVANASTIAPLDEKTVKDLASKAGAVVTVEDHQVMGGLGGAIAESLAKNHPCPVEFVGLQNTFAESGKPSELIEKYGLGRKAIKDAVSRVLKRKSDGR